MHARAYIILSLLIGNFSHAQSELFLWSEMQLGQELTGLSVSRDAVFAHATPAHAGAIVGASGRLSARLFEIELAARRIFFEGITTPNPEIDWNDRQAIISAQIARFFQSRSGYFGKLGLSLHSFLPVSDSYVRVSMTTGNNRLGSLVIEANTAILFGLSYPRTFLGISTAMVHYFSDSVGLGPRLDLQVRLADSHVNNTIHYHDLLLGVGPSLEYSADNMFARAYLQFRVTRSALETSAKSWSIFSEPAALHLCLGTIL